ncbi:hypothetical protein [Streptomyces sp. NPDC057939]|uniref:hypothetical protein n=1 Tax=Streptomyces sp. NPDC057939 TaxID=3346284 RepID=UPI0036E00D25
MMDRAGGADGIGGTGRTEAGPPGRRRPREIEVAWGLTVLAVVVELLVWVSGSFLIAPTGLNELSEVSGRAGAYRQLALSGAVMAVLLAVWLTLGWCVRAGRGRARTVLAVLTALSLLLSFADSGMNGPWPDGGELFAALPDLVATAAAVFMYLPGARGHFSTRARQPA